MKYIPKGLIVIDGRDQAVTVTIGEFRKDVGLLNKENISAAIDLGTVTSGGFSYYLTAGNVKLPNGRVHLVQISPSRGELQIQKRP